jgi:hypothetical protein
VLPSSAQLAHGWCLTAPGEGGELVGSIPAGGVLKEVFCE